MIETRKRTRAAVAAVRVMKMGRVRLARWRGVRAGGEERLQVMHGGHKVAFLDRHDQVNGVEVGLAVKASPQIRSGIDRRVILAAART